MANSSPLSLGKVSFATALIGMLVAFAVAILVVRPGVDDDHRKLTGQALAAQHAIQINMKEKMIRDQVARIAASNLISTGITGSNTELAGLEATLTSLIAGAEKVRLIPKGQARTDQGTPPFNYTALDLVNRTENGSNPHPEVISSAPQLEGDRWIIVAEAITNNHGAITGTLFVYLRGDVIADGMSPGDTGSIIVTQQVGATPKPFLNVGSAGGSASFTHPLNNPNWQVTFSTSAAFDAATPGNLLSYLLPVLIASVIALAGTFVGSTRLAATIGTDLTTLTNYLQKFAASHNANPGDYELAEFPVHEERIKLIIESAAPAPKTKSKSKSKSKSESKGATKPAKAEEVIDIEMVDEGTEIEVDDFDEAIATANSATPTGISPDIFRANDIRGIVGESLSEDIARTIGLAIGSEAGERGEDTLLVACDGREYSPALAEALISGITQSGRDVINIGAVPTPVLYYGTHNTSASSGVMVTGSHASADYNGFKIVFAGNSTVESEIQALYERIQAGNFSSGDGAVSEANLVQDYFDAIADDVVVAQPLKIVVDCGNGIAGAIAPELFDALGCETVPLYCEVDGSFPNHLPDPTQPENLEDLRLTVQSQGADFGLALDGDGDRLVAVTAEGEIVWPDKLLMLFAKDIVSRNPGTDIVYDVECSRHLNSVVSGFGGRPVMSRSGHSFIKQKVSEVGALLGGEHGGHICFAERWFGFDDGMYSAARLLEIVGSQGESLTELLKEFPDSISTPEIQIAVADSEKFGLVEKLIATADFEDATITTIDGLRVDFTDGWGLVRASHTDAALTLRFEADSEEALEDIKAAFQELLQETREDLVFS